VASARTSAKDTAAWWRLHLLSREWKLTLVGLPGWKTSVWKCLESAQGTTEGQCLGGSNSVTGLVQSHSVSQLAMLDRGVQPLA